MTNGISPEDVTHALKILGLTLPVTSEELERAKHVQLHHWNPARYANLTNHPTQYMRAYAKAEEMSKRIEAAYALLCAVLVPDESER